MEYPNDDKSEKWAELLWEEFKYRHELYWKSIFLWGGAATSIFIAPFLKPELRVLNSVVFIFPIIGLAISLIGTWHLAAESERLSVVKRKYDEIRGSYTPSWPFINIKRSWYEQAVTESTGKAITILFLVCFGTFAVIDFLLLFILLYPTIWITPFLSASFIFVTTSAIWLYRKIYKAMKKHNANPNLNSKQ
jgi:hypothetical protein